MPASARWSVQVRAGQPPAVLAGRFAMMSAALGCVAAAAVMQGAAPGVLVGLAAAALVLRRAFPRLPWPSRSAAGGPASLEGAGLAADAGGRWMLQGENGWRPVRPARIWHGPGWVTLTLAPLGEAGAAGSAQPLTLTVWRGAVPADAWRKLSILLRAHSSRAARSDLAEAA